jgi:hypothetical protein
VRLPALLSDSERELRDLDTRLTGVRALLPVWADLRRLREVDVCPSLGVCPRSDRAGVRCREWRSALPMRWRMRPVWPAPSTRYLLCLCVSLSVSLTLWMCSCVCGETSCGPSATTPSACAPTPNRFPFPPSVLSRL